MKKTTPYSIQKVVVERLFGLYDYDLYPNPKATDPDRLWILYGDNGCGKTSILKCIFALLATERNKGHKSRLGEIPFKKIVVYFQNSVSVSAERTGKMINGDYCLSVHTPHGNSTVEVSREENGSFKVKSISRYLEFLKRIDDLNLSLYMLSDDRSVRASIEGQKDYAYFGEDMVGNDEIVSRNVSMHHRRNVFMNEDETSGDAYLNKLLESSLNKVSGWIRVKAMHNSTLGEASVNNLYNDILGKLSHPGLESVENRSMERLKSRILEIERISEDASKYELLPKFTGKSMLKVLDTAPSENKKIVQAVLTHYVESVERKAEAMSQLYKQADTFTRVINEFLTDKYITFKLNSGIQIFARGGSLLKPGMLSSGERHLLLLFSNSLLAIDRPSSIFFIDEPEISLNIKWQRQFLASLKECVANSSIQYVIATHSIELLSKYTSSTIKLADKSKMAHA